MTTAIKEYKELSYIICYDDVVYTTPLSISELEPLVNNNKFLNLWWVDMVAVNQIKRIKSKKVGDVENIILWIKDRELREKLMKEVRLRKSEWRRMNKEILQNIIKNFTS